MFGYVENIRSKVGHRPVILNSASGALINANKQVLLQERVDTGDWGFPGGYLEYGETYKQALIREFQEDAGLTVLPTRLLALSDDYTYQYPNGDKVQPINCFYLVCHVNGQLLNVQTDETVSLAYFDLASPPHFFNAQHFQMFQELKRNALTL
ncbi:MULTISPECIES: NUDIX hydrolase [Lactiplantibacillus]|uniref:NUDIX hydrolase n=1 Tax=Lactiplantibacillus pentosus TaxID=1589 RepID=A0AAW8WAI5_LACPE|nr:MULTISPECIES: NUDIX hydrolase [Lactiplantibacillus]MBO9165082.1 NUDIX hydrolase [Lactiplantibacillus pentosus]MBU7462334.1 NUDIX hydrolase [Lactiplantibacillus pentosus]MBU7477220.1 NUDIX hydrolase [Lactiplantibacillus pentosus]MBU7484898.1 NUDIX hydrolase [Lactiplantibacillus sp. 30.2.29]MBU7488187.1 NUDIX hydrolase [Lactiplantibacillus pentosus]